MTALLDLPRRVLASVWIRLASLAALAAAVGAAATVPQGWAAEAYLRAPHPGPLARWATWGLTELPSQPWFWALVLLFVGSGLLSALTEGDAGDKEARSLRFRAARPESAPETAAAALRPILGEPERAEWDGTSTRLAYELGPRPGDAVRSTLGLAAVFVASVYVLQPPPPEKTVARAWVAAQEVRSGAGGVFDVVQGEELTFFQSPDLYVLRDYAPDRRGLGPALLFEWGDPRGQPYGAFWVYENAPAGFDIRHRQASVGLDVLRAEWEPVPGAGPTARPGSWGLILGVGLLLLGALARLVPPARVEVRSTGHDLALDLRGPAGRRTDRLFAQVDAAVADVFVRR